MVKDFPLELTDPQRDEFSSESDDGFAEAARRDLELDEDPSLGLTLGDFDQKIQNRRLH